MNDLQKRVRDFTAANDMDAPPEHRFLDLMAELGELAKEILKSSEYGEKPFTPDPVSWPDELGDAAFSLLALANATGTDIEDALNGALTKYQKRIDEKGEAGSGA